MKTLTIYRADDYNDAIGNLVGFFPTLEEALQAVEFTNEEADEDSQGSFPHSKITVFKVDSKFEGELDFNNREQMLSEEVWGNGDILTDLYYY